MSLEVIGAGFGRTGTLSLKAALERLGFEPCHHMVAVIQEPGQAAVWDAAARGHPPDWSEFLKEYRAIVDWPGCHFWRELAAAFPKAKVVLTERDPEAWYRSMAHNILQVVAGPPESARSARPHAQMRMAHHIVAEKTFGGDFGRENVLKVYEAHNEAVKAAIPKERLLVYDVGQGWAPLCDFLGVPLPREPFPRTNSTQEFRARANLVADQNR